MRKLRLAASHPPLVQNGACREVCPDRVVADCQHPPPRLVHRAWTARADRLGDLYGPRHLQMLPEDAGRQDHADLEAWAGEAQNCLARSLGPHLGSDLAAQVGDL